MLKQLHRALTFVIESLVHFVTHAVISLLRPFFHVEIITKSIRFFCSKYHINQWVRHMECLRFCNVCITHWFVVIQKVSKKIKTIGSTVLLSCCFCPLIFPSVLLEGGWFICHSPLNAHLFVTLIIPFISSTPHPSTYLCQAINIGVNKPIKNNMSKKWLDWAVTVGVGQGKKMSTP